MKNLIKSSNYLLQKINNSVAFISSLLTTMPNSTENTQHENPATPSYDEIYQKGYEKGYQKAQEVAKINVKNITLEPQAYFLFVKDMFDALTLNYKHAESERDFITNYVRYLKYIRKIVLELKSTNMRYETAFEKLLTEIDEVLELAYENNDKFPTVITREALHKKENAVKTAGQRLGKIEGSLDTYEALAPKSVTQHTLNSLNDLQKTIEEVRQLDFYTCRSESVIVFEGLQIRLNKLREETQAKMRDAPILKNTPQFEEGRDFGELQGYAKGVITLYTQFGLNREEIARPIFKALLERLKNATPPEIEGLDFKQTISDLTTDVALILLDQLKDQVITRGLDKKALTLEEISSSHAESTALVLKQHNPTPNRTFSLTNMYNNMKWLFSPARLGAPKTLPIIRTPSVPPVNTTNDFVIPKNLLETSSMKKPDKSQTKISPVPEIVQQIPVADSVKSGSQNDTNLMNLQERIRQDFVSKEPFPNTPIYTTHAEHRNTAIPFKPAKPMQPTFWETPKQTTALEKSDNLKSTLVSTNFPVDSSN